MRCCHLHFHLLLVSVFLAGCASYDRDRMVYQQMVMTSDYEGAVRHIEKKKYYKRERNQVLFYLERGTLARMAGELEESNRYLNQADLLIEDRRSGIGAQGLATISNPRVLPYRTEYFENVAVHYYKSLNYLQMQDAEAARVEARRVGIRLQELNDAVPDKPLKYRDDALGHILMGLSYEMNGEWNNAFIAYRNAANLFLRDQQEEPYMGVRMPAQLRCDLVRMAERVGFQAEADRYRRLLQPVCDEDRGEGGSLVLFWENGQAPMKVENIIGFQLRRTPGQDRVQFVDERRGMVFDPGPEVYLQHQGFLGLSLIRLALPEFQRQPYPLRRAEVIHGGGTRRLELVEDLNVIAVQSLRDRFARELTQALVRLAAKKAMEAGLRQIKTRTDEKPSSGDTGKPGQQAPAKEQGKAPGKDTSGEYDETLGIVLSGAMSIVNAATERADIRSWQTLPAEIHYQRIPLKQGQQDLVLRFYDQRGQLTDEYQLKVEGRGTVQVRSVFTPQAKVVDPPLINPKKTEP